MALSGLKTGNDNIQNVEEIRSFCLLFDVPVDLRTLRTFLGSIFVPIVAGFALCMIICRILTP